MKIINLIFAFYLVALSCLPCTDIEVESAAHSKITANHEDHSHDKDSDSCSPFCICNCCGVQFISLTSTVVLQIPTVSVKIETQQSFYKSTLTSNFCGSIWQPPQIA